MLLGMPTAQTRRKMLARGLWDRLEGITALDGADSLASEMWLALQEMETLQSLFPEGFPKSPLQEQAKQWGMEERNQ